MIKYGETRLGLDGTSKVEVEVEREGVVASLEVTRTCLMPPSKALHSTVTKFVNFVEAISSSCRIKSYAWNK